MISIAICFYFMILFFGAIGGIRGWQKEAFALAGLVGSIAFLHFFGSSLINIGDGFFNLLSADDGGAANEDKFRRAFWIQAIFHSAVAFFSYQIISNFADGGQRGRGVQSGFQNSFIGWVLGMLNGYLLVGTLWGFLEYEVIPEGYDRFPPGDAYFFDASVVRRVSNAAETAFDVAEYLPVGVFNPGLWLLFFFISFFIVIIAIV